MPMASCVRTFFIGDTVSCCCLDSLARRAANHGRALALAHSTAASTQLGPWGMTVFRNAWFVRRAASLSSLLRANLCADGISHPTSPFTPYLTILRARYADAVS